MGLFMKVIGSMGEPLVKESSLILKGKYMLGNGIEIEHMEKVNICTKMEKHTKDNG